LWLFLFIFCWYSIGIADGKKLALPGAKTTRSFLLIFANAN